ncbi:MAG: EAL domain-containing protein [Lachnospiraceae bacterium]
MFQNREELQRLQNKFSEVAKVAVFCVDKNGKTVTGLSGVEPEAADFFAQIDRSRFDGIVRELSESMVEDQIVENTNVPGVMAAGQSIKADGELNAVWLVIAVLQDGGTVPYEGYDRYVTQKGLYQALDFLREFSGSLFSLEEKYRAAHAERLRSSFSEKEMEGTLKRISAMTEIVQLLESDDAIEAIFQKTLRIVGEFFKISSAEVFQVHDDSMDVLAEWLAEGMVSYFDHTRNQKRPEILRKDKLIVLSSDTKLLSEEKAFLEQVHVKATVIVPIMIGDTVGMYACFNECRKERTWEVEDIKFINNATRVMHSIIMRRIQKNSLTSSYAALEAILDNVGSAIYVEDRQSNKLLFGNRIMKKLFSEELEQGTLHELLEFASDSDGESSRCEFFHEAGGQWYDLYCTTIRWVDGRQAVLYVFYDISDKKIYQSRIELQAYTDFLTGLYNRMCCERDLAWYIDEARNTGRYGALLYIDLDDFKHINDGLGHQYGDILLKAISHSFQQVDGVSDTCYRVGGDEFIIIIPPESYDKYDEIISSVREIFTRPWSLRDGEYYCTMSMGSVIFPEGDDSVQELIKKADIAMYEAKKSGKNRMSSYSDSIQSSSNKRLNMEKNMRSATAGGMQEFEVYYQPIIVPDGKYGKNACCGAEALVRWNSPELGFISPADFIPLAEYLGLITPIGNHVLMEACRECKKWNDAGYPYFKVNVNLSVVQLQQNDIVEVVENVLKETGITPRNLTLEVTESLAINDMERMKRILGRIRELGVRIALDDFGTGYSSLNHIREIPLDVIKIDQSFVKDLGKNKYSPAFVRMVSELADAIEVNVCVEGVETEEQYNIVGDMNVSMIQGYYFDKPMSKNEFEEKYVKEKA